MPDCGEAKLILWNLVPSVYIESAALLHEYTMPSALHQDTKYRLAWVYMQLIGIHITCWTLEKPANAIDTTN